MLFLATAAAEAWIDAGELHFDATFWWSRNLVAMVLPATLCGVSTGLLALRAPNRASIVGHAFGFSSLALLAWLIASGKESETVLLYDVAVGVVPVMVFSALALFAHPWLAKDADSSKSRWRPLSSSLLSLVVLLVPLGAVHLHDAVDEDSWSNGVRCFLPSCDDYQPRPECSRGPGYDASFFGPLDDINGVYREIIDAVSGAHGLRPLWRTANPPDESDIEIRILLTSRTPSYFLRLRRAFNDGGSGYRVSGIRALWWHNRLVKGKGRFASQTATQTKEAAEAVKMSRARALAGGCDRILEHDAFESCVVQTSPEFPWKLTFDALNAFGIVLLPQAPQFLGCGGYSLVVEVRQGFGYRAYHYWSPGYCPDSLVAARMARFVEQLFGRSDR